MSEKKYLSTAEKVDAIKFGIQLAVFWTAVALVVVGGVLTYMLFKGTILT